MLGEDQSHTYEEQAVALTSGKISEAQKKKKKPYPAWLLYRPRQQPSLFVELQFYCHLAVVRAGVMWTER